MKKWRIVGYIVLVLSLILLDQSTKIHTEQTYLEYSHDTDMRNYSSSHLNVFHWGVSPIVIYDQKLSADLETKNWLDFNLTYVRNPGAAWGSFGNMPESYRLWVFYTITLIAMIIIVRMFMATPLDQLCTKIGLLFVMAGALGNFTDRLLLHYVIDMLHFHWKIWGWEYSFPVFNFADVYINIGVGLMLLDMLFQELKLRKSSKQETASGPTSIKKLDTQS